MAHPKPKPKKQRATAVTDLCRLVVRAMGCGLISLSIAAYVDDESDWPLGPMLVLSAIGLGFIGWGIWGKPESFEGI